MRRIAVTFALLAGPLLALPSGAHGAADALTCTGSPQPRVSMESQTSWSPQQGPASHPGTGKLGDIHVETCFPLYQHFGATGTIPFDITVRMHNWTGQVKDIHIDAYGDAKLVVATNLNWSCPTAECVRTFHAELPLNLMRYSGLHAIQLEVYMSNPSGITQYTLPRWPAYLDNGKPRPPAGSEADGIARMIEARGVIADSYFTHNGPGENHAGPVAIARADFPWDPATGQPGAIAGVWEPTIFWVGDTGFAYLDAALHAEPPVKTVIYEGPGYAWAPRGTSRLRIDTRTLPDGPHALLLGTCVKYTNGTHCAAENVRFTVANGKASTPAAPAADTTRPVLSRLTLSSKRFRAARSGPSTRAARVGTRISYELSEAAQVRFRIQRAVSGRRAGGRCVAPKRAKRRAKRCIRYRTLRGSFSDRGSAGINRLTFRGRLRGHKQAPGRYRMVAVATDPASNASAPVRARYRITRR